MILQNKNKSKTRKHNGPSCLWLSDFGPKESINLQSGLPYKGTAKTKWLNWKVSRERMMWIQVVIPKCGVTGEGNAPGSHCLKSNRITTSTLYLVFPDLSEGGHVFRHQIFLRASGQAEAHWYQFHT
jgi:hypothetical protein